MIATQACKMSCTSLLKFLATKIYNAIHPRYFWTSNQTCLEKFKIIIIQKCLSANGIRLSVIILMDCAISTSIIMMYRILIYELNLFRKKNIFKWIFGVFCSKCLSVETIASGQNCHLLNIHTFKHLFTTWAHQYFFIKPPPDSFPWTFWINI